MNKKEIFELFEFMTTRDKSVFVSDFSGWGEAAKIPGYTDFSSSEGNGIRSNFNGAEFEPQYESVRQGGQLEVQYREEDEVIKRVILSDLFPKTTPVVIVTGSEVLRRICPMFQRRSEMMDWMHLVCEYVAIRGMTISPVPYYWEGNMLELARYLYENRADKISDKSIYDKLVL